MLGKIESKRRKGQQRMRRLDSITNLMGMSLSKLQELLMDRKPAVLQSMGSQRVGHDWATELNWVSLMNKDAKILIPACPSPSSAFLMMYSAYKLKKQGDNTWHTPFPIWNQSVVPCPVLTAASWPAYRFLRRQVRWFGIPISFIVNWITVPLKVMILFTLIFYIIFFLHL